MSIQPKVFLLLAKQHEYWGNNFFYIIYAKIHNFNIVQL